MSELTEAFHDSAQADLAALGDGTVSYTPKGGSPKTISAGWNFGEYGRDLGEDGTHKGRMAELLIMTDATLGVTDPAPGDTVTTFTRSNGTVASTLTWVVTGRTSKGGGLAQLALEVHDPDEYASPAGRVRR